MQAHRMQQIKKRSPSNLPHQVMLNSPLFGRAVKLSEFSLFSSLRGLARSYYVCIVKKAECDTAPQFFFSNTLVVFGRGFEKKNLVKGDISSRV